MPGLWFMSWYDVSVGPNLELYNHVRKTASPAIANEQWAIIAPVAHCSYTRATADTSSANGAWATRGLSTTRSSMASSIAS